MKKLLLILLSMMLIVGCVGCGKKSDGDVAANGIDNHVGESSDIIGDNEEQPSVERPVDAYVADFRDDGTTGVKYRYLVCESGAVESVETSFKLERSSDGHYAVWRDYDELYYKRPGQEDAVKISGNVTDFVLEPQSGFLVIFCDDGIYYADFITNPPVKVSDICGGEGAVLSIDCKSVGYVIDGELHVLWLDRGYSDVVVDTDVRYGYGFDYINGDKISYVKEGSSEKGLYAWNGSQVEKVEEPFNREYYYIDDDLLNELSGLHASLNKRYLVGYDRGALLRYEISDGKLINEMVIDDNISSSSIYVNDDGLVCYRKRDTLFVYTSGKVIEFEDVYDGMAGLPQYVTIGKILYYTNADMELIEFDLDTEEQTVVCENVKTIYEENGYCYYITAESVLYRVGIEEPLRTSVSSLIY